MRDDRVMVRLTQSELQTLQELARRESEGNKSMMLRKAIREAGERRGLLPVLSAHPAQREDMRP